MKKLLLSIAVLLPGLLAHSQGADDLGRYAEMSFIPRLDLNPTLGTGDSGLGFNLGNSSFYTLFEGSFSEHFSLTVANHWIQAGGDYAWPYTSLGYSDTTNWLDYLRADFTFSNWNISLGKDMISTGGFEFDDWDWDVHYALASPLFMNLACYQWGGKVAYTTDSEMSNFSLQMTTSPYGEHPFSSNLWSYSAQWWGEYGWFSNIWSITALQYDKGDYDLLINLGERFSIGEDWTLAIDWRNMGSIDEESGRLLGGNYFLGKLTYAPSDRFDISLTGNYVSPRGEGGENWFNAGAVFQYYPLSGTDDLRLHAFVAYDSLLSEFSLNIGARYNIRIKVW